MTLPTAVDLRRGISVWLGLGNLTNNDCTVAAYEHVNMVKNLATTSWWGRLAYRLGYRPPSNIYATNEYVDFLATLHEPPGVGVDPGQFLAWEQSKGRVTEFQNISLSGDFNTIIRQAMIDWTGCLLTVKLTKEAYNIGTGRGAWVWHTGDVAQWGLYHAIAMVGYGPLNNIIVTWGLAKDMSLEFTQNTLVQCWVWK